MKYHQRTTSVFWVKQAEILLITELKHRYSRVRQLAYVAYVRTPTFDICIIFDMRTLTCMLNFSQRIFKVFKTFLVLIV